MNRGKFPTVFVVIAAVLIAVVVIIMAVFAFFSSRNSYYGNGYGYYGGMCGMMGGFGGFPMMLFMIPIMLIVLVVIGYFIWRGLGWGYGCGGGRYGHYASSEGKESAMEILARRYANGEITQQQFEQMKKDIIN